VAQTSPRRAPLMYLTTNSVKKGVPNGTPTVVNIIGMAGFMPFACRWSPDEAPQRLR
jgi:hypothetical protein